MNNEYVSGLHIVRVTMTDMPEQPFQLWIAAVPREEAVAAVLRRVKVGWTAELSNQRVTKEIAERVKLRPGDVSELTRA